MSTINRGPFNALVDDDGSGTTGTIWNKAAIQSVILDPADAAYGTVVQTTTLTGTQNDFALVPNCRILNCQNIGLLTLTGFSAGYEGQLLTIQPVSNFQVDILNNNAGSTTKCLNFVTSGPTSLSPFGPGAQQGGIATYTFIGGYWRLLAHEQGGWINVPYSAANFSANSGTWTVPAGSVNTYSYRLSGRTLWLAIYLVNTTLSGGQTELRVALPAGYSATGMIASAIPWIAAGVSSGTALVFASAPTYLGFYVSAYSAPWPASSGATFALTGTAILQIT